MAPGGISRHSQRPGPRFVGRWGFFLGFAGRSPMTTATQPSPRRCGWAPDRPGRHGHSRGGWRATLVRRYGRTDTVQITERACLWYGSFRSRTVRVILVRDDKPRTRDRDDRGYGLPLVTTDLESAAEDVVARYASRWGIEQAFAGARQMVGVGEARNRIRRAVERTVPFGRICFSVVTLWYTRHGHTPDDVTSHGARARWYHTKTEPSYDGMTIKLRRSSSPPEFAAHALNGPPARSSGRRWDMINQTAKHGWVSVADSPFRPSPGESRLQGPTIRCRMIAPAPAALPASDPPNHRPQDSGDPLLDAGGRPPTLVVSRPSGRCPGLSRGGRRWTACVIGAAVIPMPEPGLVAG